MRRLIPLMLAVLVLIGCSRSKEYPSGRLVFGDGEFSFVTPKGWNRTKIVGLPYVIVSGPANQGFEPNVFVESFGEEQNDVDVLGELVVKYAKNHASYKADDVRTFDTATGLRGSVLEAGRVDEKGMPLALFHYSLTDGTNTLVVTCTCAEGVKGEYGTGAFESVVESVEFSLNVER